MASDRSSAFIRQRKRWTGRKIQQPHRRIEPHRCHHHGYSQTLLTKLYMTFNVLTAFDTENWSENVFVGNNGTVDGQGSFWWQKFHSKKLKYTRGYLVELMYSSEITISNLTFVNSPAWNIHPVYSRFSLYILME
ncbi:uncharacterized protein A4U43_C08F2230 [Asparagus officinalis]|nr:uncharacterized protein A4U43_C08F2230 [Asparagus officinalis]